MAEIVYTSSEDEARFNLGQGDSKVADTNSYVSVLSVNKYEYMDHAYQGSKGFRDGSYLIPHDREMFYRKRRDYSVYKNFIRPIVSALVDPVYAEECDRVILDTKGNDTGSPIARSFIDDVDGAGTSMQEYMYDTMIRSRLHGVCFTLVDNFSAESQASTVQQALTDRTYPYCVRKYAWEVTNYHTDEVGRLTDIWFCEPPRVAGNHTYERARQWTDTHSQLMERDKSSQSEGKREWYPVDGAIYHNLGIIPVAISYSTSRESMHDILPDPPLYDVARLNHLIYNKDSEIRDLERNSGFPVLYYQSDVGGNITLSNHNAIVVPPTGTMAPGYISPDSGIMTALVENNKYYLEDLFRSAEQSGVHAVHTSQAISGVALAWKFFSVENQLRKTAHTATVTEQQIMYILSLYTGETYDYAVDYPTTYQPGDRLQVVSQYKEIVAMSPPEILKKIIFKKIAGLLTSDDTDENIKDIQDALDTEYEEIKDPVQAPVTVTPKEEGVVEDIVHTKDPSTVPADEELATGEGLKPDTVLNGAQVTSLVDICVKVTEGFPRANAVAIAMAAFGLTTEAAEAMIPEQGNKPKPPEDIKGQPATEDTDR